MANGQAGAQPWRVVNQREQYMAGPDGVYGQYVVVSFVTSDGDTGQVEVPKATYSAAAVAQAVASYAAQLASLRAMTG